MKRKQEPTESEEQEIRDRFKGDPDAFFSRGEDANTAARRRTRRRERYADRLAEGFGMIDPDREDESDDDAEQS